MFTIHTDETTLDQINDLGNRIAEDVVKLENLIWLVKAESVKQLAEAARAYTAAYDKNSTTSELATALEQAAARLNQLEKFWSQEVGMRNRAVQFGDMRSRKIPGWQALETVMKLKLAAGPEEIGDESTD